MKQAVLSMTIFILISGISFAMPSQTEKIPEPWLPLLLEAEKSGSSQLLLALTSSAGQTRAELYCLEKASDTWRFAMPTIEAAVGRKGIAEPSLKREGDGKSPYGIFPVSISFGYDAKNDTRMPYKQVTADDIWVDDPDSPEYNRMVKKGTTQAKSFEEMKRKDEMYKLGLVVEYNTNPVTPGHGSAIFIHIWKKPFSPTAGCLALSEEDIKNLLKFLDPEQKPLVGFIRKDLIK
ncbi:MAG: L,D-transpeptidase family protein [Candidatus Rifleibacteriota bacterium]